MMIYKTRFGEEHNLANWPKEHVNFIRRAYVNYCLNIQYDKFVVFISGPNSPVLDKKKNGPIPTRTPLYNVATDLELRLGVKQDLFIKDWEGPIDPEWPFDEKVENN